MVVRLGIVPCDAEPGACGAGAAERNTVVPHLFGVLKPPGRLTAREPLNVLMVGEGGGTRCRLGEEGSRPWKVSP